MELHSYFITEIEVFWPYRPNGRRCLCTVDQMGVDVLRVDVFGVDVLKLDVMPLPCFEQLGLVCCIIGF